MRTQLFITALIFNLLMSGGCIVALQKIQSEHKDLLQKIAALQNPQSISTTATPSNQQTQQLTNLQGELEQIKQQIQQLPAQAVQQSNKIAAQNSAYSNDTLTMVESLRAKTYLTKEELNNLTEQSKLMNKTDNKLYLETLFAKLEQDSFEIYDSAGRE